jgi:lysophospholipase L1-like esterase/chitodextrinase
MRRGLGVLALSAALVGAVGLVIAAAPGARAATPVRIMPLGDSITGSPGCWRALLWQRLQQNGLTNVDMVGTLPPQGCSVPYDGDNEGHGGALATAVADQNQLVGWLAATHPDIVMMHFGTNDVWSGRTTDQILTAYGTLVDQMRASNAATKILVAQIIPVAPSGCADCPARTAALNNAIPGWAASKTTTLSPITVVDQWTGWNPGTDTNDGVHPNDSGNVKMANGWYGPLTAALGGTASGTDTRPPTVPTNLTSRVACNPLQVTLNWAASTDNVGVTGYDIFAANSAGGPFSQVGTSTAPTVTLPLRFLNYEVRARDAAGNVSAFTAPLMVIPPPCPSPPPSSAPPSSAPPSSAPPDNQPPTTPGTPTASGVTASQATLSWTASTDNVRVTGYDIFRAPGANGGTFTSVGSSSTVSFTDTGLAAATTYRYQVRARDAAGNTSPFSAAVTVTTPGGGSGGCTAVYSPVGNPWPGGFQGQVTVTNTGTTATTAWTVTLTFANGQAITQLWGARTTGTASPYTITNETYNGVLAANASTTFGFLASWNGTNNAPTVACTRTP